MTQNMTDKSCALLVVDDEPFNRTLIKRQLDTEGYEDVSFAENGREALDFMRGDEDYKYRFGGVNRHVQRVQIGRS